MCPFSALQPQSVYRRTAASSPFGSLEAVLCVPCVQALSRLAPANRIALFRPAIGHQRKGSPPGVADVVPNRAIAVFRSPGRTTAVTTQPLRERVQPRHSLKGVGKSGYRQSLPDSLPSDKVRRYGLSTAIA